MKEAIQQFKKKYKKTFTKKGVLWTKVKRKATTPKQALQLLIKDVYVSKRVKRIKL